jgi:hypothetical protein
MSAMINKEIKHISTTNKYTTYKTMKTTTSTPMLWTEMTDDLSEAVNGGKYGCHQSYYYCEKPKEEKKCKSYEEPTYCYEEKYYNKCDSYKSKWW